MIICTIHFDNDRTDFTKLLKVWEHSARLHNPTAKVFILTVPAPAPVKRKCDQFLTYTSSYAAVEMAKWALKQNDNVIMTDADIMFLGDCSSAFKESFDMGVTVRFARSWINAGVVFYQPRGKDKLKEYIDLMLEHIAHPEDHIEDIHKYLGADQTALIKLTKKYNFKRFLCSEWNLEQNSWSYFDDNTKIVHMKSNLLDLVNRVPPRIQVDENHVTYKIYDIWRQYLQEAQGGNDQRPEQEQE